MGPFLAALLAAFGPQIGELIAGIGKFLIDELISLLGNATAATAKAQEAVVAAERITVNVTTDAAQALAWAEGQYKDLAGLEAVMPGSMQAVMAKHILMSDVQVPHSVAAHAVQIGFANGRLKAAAKP